MARWTIHSIRWKTGLRRVCLSTNSKFISVFIIYSQKWAALGKKKKALNKVLPCWTEAYHACNMLNTYPSGYAKVNPLHTKGSNKSQVSEDDKQATIKWLCNWKLQAVSFSNQQYSPSASWFFSHNYCINTLCQDWISLCWIISHKNIGFNNKNRQIWQPCSQLQDGICN